MRMTTSTAWLRSLPCVSLPVGQVNDLVATARKDGETKSRTAEIPVGNTKRFVTMNYDPARDTLTVDSSDR